MAVLIWTLLALFHVAAGRSTPGGKLLEFSCSQQEIYGKYASQDGVHGINFFSRADDYLLVSTLSGVNIVETSPFSGTDGKELRAVYIMGYEYIQHRNPALSDQPVGHSTALSDALRKFLDMEETALLEEAAEAVGERGINGKNTPAAMPFFMFALRITQLHTKGPYISNTTLAHRHKRLAPCFSNCPPCPNDECYGQCGYGCDCWEWACGDCCFHLGCYDHDACCREGFFQLPCLVPVGFNCDGPYLCY